MKILHIIDSGGLYGAEVVLLNLLAEQVKQGIEPIIASIGEKNIAEKPLEQEAKKKGFTVQPFRMRPGPNFIGAGEILQFARRQHIDLLHSHGYKGNILFGLMPKRLRRIPIVATVHGWTSTSGFSKMKIYEWLDSLALKRLDAVVLVNKAMKKHARLVGRKQLKLHVVDNGIPTGKSQQLEDDAPLDSAVLDFCKTGLTVGAIGRLSAEKGFLNLLDALAILQRKKYDIRLLIIGEGGQRVELEKQIIELGLENNVLLAGYKKNAKAYIPCFDVFALSSLTEGLPMTILEVMDAGVPIVSTRVGGVPEVLANGVAGVLVDSPEPDDIADGINALINQPTHRNDLIDKAKARVHENYSSQKMAREYLNIYRSVLA